MLNSMADRWTELPKHIFDLITKRLELEDLIRVNCACHTWKSFTSSLLPTNLNPWLIVPQKDSTHNEATTYGQILGFFNLSDRRVYKIETPAISDRRICGSCQGGWLITVHEKGEIQMLHPFSKIVIDLPPITKLPGVGGSFIDQDGDFVYDIPTSVGKEVYRKNIVASCIRDYYIYKVITSSSNPNTCTVMAIQGLDRSLAFCRPGNDKKWRLVKGDDNVRFADVTYYKGKFYAVNNAGHVFAVDGLDSDSPCLKLFIKSARSFDTGKYYLVESLGELMLVLKMTYASLDFEEMMEEAMEENYPSYKTSNFRVRKLDFNGPKWVDIREFDRALFVGYNHSFSISILDLVGCKRNSIYFTDDNMNEYTDQPFGGHDYGVFDTMCGEIQRLYPSDSKFLMKPPPVWYTTMSASEVDRWTELPICIFELITKRLELVDIIRASCVCHTWKTFASALLPANLDPWLIVPQEDTTNNEATTYGQTLGFLNLSDLKVYKIEIPAIANRRICGSCRGGWLVTVHEKGEIQILHPFTKLVIDLPPITKLPGVGRSFIDQDGDLVYNIPTGIGKKLHRKNIIASCIRDIYIYKVITSSSNLSTCIVMAIQGLFRVLAFCRPGMDKKWRLVNGGDGIRFADVTYFKGKFYAVNNSGQVFVVNGLDGDSPCLKLFIDSVHSYGMGKYYLVESLGELLFVWKITYAPLDFEEMMEETMEENYPSYKTRDFRVCKLDFNGQKWVDISEIDRALFVGYNHSFSISTSDLAGCKSNSIYFTDDNMDEYTNQPFGGHDFGVFDMMYGGIRRLYPSESKFLMKPPPVWFTTFPC